MKKWICAALLCVLLCALCPVAMAYYHAGNMHGNPCAYITGGEIGILLRNGGEWEHLAYLPWTEEAQTKRFKLEVPSGAGEKYRLKYSADKLNIEFDKEAVDAHMQDIKQMHGISMEYVDDYLSVMRQTVAVAMMYTSDGDEFKHIWKFKTGQDYMVSNADNGMFYIINCSQDGSNWKSRIDFYFPESLRLNYVLSNGPKLKDSLYHAAQDVLYDVVYDKGTDKELKLVFKGAAQYKDQGSIIELEGKAIDKKHYTLEASGDDLIVTLDKALMQSLALSEEAGYHQFNVGLKENNNDLVSVVFVNVTETVAANVADMPSTGDHQNLMPWAVLLMLSAVSMMTLFRKKSRA